MPFIQIDLERKVYEEKGKALSQGIHQALIEALDMPVDDYFQVFRPHEEGELVYRRTIGGKTRETLIFVRITMVHMFDVKTKKAMYAAILEKWGALGIAKSDINICVVENGYEDWYDEYFAGDLS
ncbi:MAG: tautomerase family protein [Propionibacteriaceae bacterium]|jgi:hypothetical protein|nr:tautomerase family protein [Propionibacteriaceae bacterium]